MEYLPAPMSRRDILIRIERLDVPADAKVLLARLVELTVAVGERLHAIGRQILSFVFEVVQVFPNTTFGLVIGAVLAVLVGSMALLGGLLGPIFGPLLIALGVGIGALEDIKHSALREQVAAFRARTEATLRG